MKSYLSIYRPLNLLFIGFAQWLAAYRLDRFADIQFLREQGLYLLIAGTLLIAAFGYWINDYYDRERDLINKPNKNVIEKLPGWIILIHLIVFAALALLLGYFINLFYLSVFSAALALLWVYSLFLKDTAGMGNVIIAFLSFLAIYMLRWMFPEIDPFLLVHFAAIAGFLNLSREVVKDAEDMEGDSAVNAKTIPIVFGLDFTNRLVYFVILFVISFVAISVFYQRQFFKTPDLYVYWAYYLLFVIIPLYRLAVSIRYGDENRDYSRYSSLIKYVLYTGILSILFF